MEEKAGRDSSSPYRSSVLQYCEEFLKCEGPSSETVTRQSCSPRFFLKCDVGEINLPFKVRKWCSRFFFTCFPHSEDESRTNDRLVVFVEIFAGKRDSLTVLIHWG